MDIIFSLIILAFIIVVLINTIFAERNKVVNMPSTPQTRRVITDDIISRKGDAHALVICDLGSGWGGLCRRLSKIFPKATVLGYELSPIPYLYSRLVQALDVSRSYTIYYKDLFTVDIKKADIIICYLSPYHMKRFENEVVSHMKAGSILYSQGFPLQELEPSSILEAPYSLEKKIYCYKIS